MPAPRGKSDTIDAEETARAVLAGYALAEPKAATGRVECVRQLRIGRRGAVKARGRGGEHRQGLRVGTPKPMEPDGRP
jgi:hypothetical protein